MAKNKDGKLLPRCRRHNPIAKAVSRPAFRNRVVEPRVGYVRRVKHKELVDGI